MRNGSRRVMATPLGTPARPCAARSSAGGSRSRLAALPPSCSGSCCSAAPAQAAPATSAEAAASSPPGRTTSRWSPRSSTRRARPLAAQQATAQAAAGHAGARAAAARPGPAAGARHRPVRLDRGGAELLPGADDQRLRRRLRRPDVAPCRSSPATRTASSARRPRRTKPPPAGAGHRPGGGRQAQATYDKVAAQQRALQAQVAEYQADFDRLSARRSGRRSPRATARPRPAAPDERRPPSESARSWPTARPRRSPSTPPWPSAASPTCGRPAGRAPSTARA